MLQLLSSGFVSLWLNGTGIYAQPVEVFALQLLPPLPKFATIAPRDPVAETTIDRYLQRLTAKGLSAERQGIWIQSGWQRLASNQGTVPLPAASITKVATTLAALDRWGAYHRFETLLSTTGTVRDGVLEGDLIVTGGSDPFFVWEEAIAVGNALNRLGIRRVTGDLVVEGNFAMNYESDPSVAAGLLVQALNYEQWNPEAIAQHATLPPGTPKPQIEIAGQVRTVAQLSSDTARTRIIRRYSLPLAQILKQMNIYSNNLMAQMLADSVGGASVVAQRAAQVAGVSPEEIQLINGSGLGQENRISPRAACAMLAAIQRYLAPVGLNLADLFPVSGRDVGTLIDRDIPAAAVVKTGTLWNVSALAGVLPTRDRGLVWFATINGGDNVDGFRQQQDILLKTLQQQWGATAEPPVAIRPNAQFAAEDTRLGAERRTQVLLGG